MSFAILGLGTAQPPTVVTQEESAAAAQTICCRTPKQAAFVAMVYRMSGIETRHVVFQASMVRDILDGTAESQSAYLPSGRDSDLGPSTGVRMQSYAEEAGKLAIPAAQRALERAEMDPAEVTHLITVSCTGFRAPGVDFDLIQQLGLARTVERVHVGFMGCHGTFNALRVARGFTAERPGTRVLLCSVELCSLHYHYGWSAERMVGNALFADGAAAVVGVAPSEAPADAWKVAASGSCLFPDTADDMTWRIGEHGFEMTLSPRVPGLIQQNLAPWLTMWLASLGLSTDTVASWAVHPGGPRILTAVEEALGLPAAATDDSREVLRTCGNMSSATILYVLDRMRARQAPRPCVALGFGPGLTAEAMLIL
jgi:predicted naringenin-chalcone synthase